MNRKETLNGLYSWDGTQCAQRISGERYGIPFIVALKSLDLVFKLEPSGYRAASALRRPATRPVGRPCCPGSPRFLRAGPGRTLISRGSIVDLQLGQVSSGLVE